MSDPAVELAALRAFTISHLAAIEESLAESKTVFGAAHRERIASRIEATKAAAEAAGATEELAGELARKLSAELDVARQRVNRPLLR
jgi:hypothetical protein